MNWLWQGFLACSPQHPILKNVIISMCKKIATNSYEVSHFDITGPARLGYIVNKYMNRSENSFFDIGTYKQYNIKILDSSALNNLGILYHNKEVIQRHIIRNSKFVKICGKEKYGGAWYNSRVYKFKLQ